MGKVVRIGGRGTSRRVAEKSPDNWSGESFRDVARKKKESAKDAYVTVGRGTKKVKFGELGESKSVSAKGRYVATGRGTGRRRVE